MASVRTTVKLPESEYEALKALADRREISFTHALRQAIQSELFIQHLVDENAKLIVQPEEGELQQLVFMQAAPANTDPASQATAGEAAVEQQAEGAVDRPATGVHAEESVVEKLGVPKERVRLEREKYTDEETIFRERRKEQIEAGRPRR